jgi:glutathione S-transferase
VCFQLRHFAGLKSLCCVDGKAFDGSEKFKDDDEKGKKHKEADARWVRLIHNDLENLPLGLVVAWGSLLCNPAAKIQSILLWVFCVGRVGHSFAYANAMQPARAYCWMAGVAGILGMGINGLVAALK